MASERIALIYLLIIDKIIKQLNHLILPVILQLFVRKGSPILLNDNAQIPNYLYVWNFFIFTLNHILINLFFYLGSSLGWLKLLEDRHWDVRRLTDATKTGLLVFFISKQIKAADLWVNNYILMNPTEFLNPWPTTICRTRHVTVFKGQIQKDMLPIWGDTTLFVMGKFRRTSKTWLGVLSCTNSTWNTWLKFKPPSICKIIFTAFDNSASIV